MSAPATTLEVPPDPAALPPASPGVVRFWNAAGCLFGLAILAVILACNGNYLGAHRDDQTLRGGDFLQEYVGGYIVAHGDRTRMYDPLYADALEHDPALVGFTFSDRQYLPMVYPPFYYRLVSPLAELPYTTALYVWYALMAAAGAAAVLLWRRQYPAVALLPAWAVPLAALYAPLLESMTSNQKGTLLLLLFTAAYRLLHRGRPFAAGLVFGLVAFKPQFALVLGLAMLWKGQWRFVAGSALTAAALVGVSLALGLDVCRQYAEFARGAGEYINTAGFPHHRAHTWQAFFRLLLPDAPGPASALTLLAGAATVGLVLWALRGPFGDRRRLPLQFSALIVATVLLSPHLLTYDLTVLLLPMLLVAVETATGNPYLAGRRRLAVGWLLACYVLSAVSASAAARTGVQVSVPLLFLFLLGVARLPRSAGPTPPAPCEATAAVGSFSG